jgi:hypothetical protein
MSTFHGEEGFFGPPKVQEAFKRTRGLQHQIFFIFDGKQHLKNIWFRASSNHP